MTAAVSPLFGSSVSRPAAFGEPDAPVLFPEVHGEMTRMDGLWFGSSAVRPLAARHQSEVWHSPLIAVGSQVVWRGRPELSAQEARVAARDKLVEGIRSLLAS